MELNLENLKNSVLAELENNDVVINEEVTEKLDSRIALLETEGAEAFVAELITNDILDEVAFEEADEELVDDSDNETLETVETSENQEIVE